MLQRRETQRTQAGPSSQTRRRAQFRPQPRSCRFLGMARVSLFSLLLFLCGLDTARSEVYLNELVWTPTGAVYIELYNDAQTQVDLSGWRIETNLGSQPIPQNTVIEPDGRTVIASTGGLHQPIGGMLGIIDDLDRMQDRVRYGVFGGAPAPPPSTGLLFVSLARSPDAGSDPSPPRVPNADGLFWSLDLTPTPGTPNDVPNPDLGRDLCINEILQDPYSNLQTAIEICGPSGFMGGGTDLTGWYIATAAGIQPLSGVVPTSGFLAITVDPSLALGDTYRVDLYDPRGVRVYQKSIYGVPTPQSVSHGDCPDGSAPPDGYDYVTCGGGVDFLPLANTIGSSNAPNGVCLPPGYGGDPDRTDEEGGSGEGDDGDGHSGGGEPRGDDPSGIVREESWGKVKAILGNPRR